MKNTRQLITAGLASLLCGPLFAADITVDRIISSSTTWTNDNTYYLSGYTFVTTPQGAPSTTVLTIEPGTVIKGRLDAENGEAAALVITRGAQINANGTWEQPIIFTSELDELNGNLTKEDVGLWGGLVVLGDASISSRADSQIVPFPVVDQIEGFAVSEAEIPLVSFGGTNDDDNSGIIRFVSIRHGGAVLGIANEINGLTMGGVGRGTTIEFVEVYANKDDAFEWFGGTVDSRYLVAAFSNDDSFDYDQGWRGRGQFWFTIGADVTVDRMDKAGEHDGATAPLDATPVGGTTVFNVTYIGIGDSLQPDGSPARGNTALNIRDNAISRYYNSIFVDFQRMLDIEADNFERLQAGDVDFSNNIFWSHIPANNNPAGLVVIRSGNSVGGNPVTIDPSFFFSEAGRNNQIVNPMLKSIGRDTNGMLDPRPAPGSPALSGSLTNVPNDGWYVQTNYKGAFDATWNWMAGWTKLSQDGYFSSETVWIPTSLWGWISPVNGNLKPDQWIWVADKQTWMYLFEITSEGAYIVYILP